MPGEDCNTKKPKTHTVSVNVLALHSSVWLSLVQLQWGWGSRWVRILLEEAEGVWMLPLPLVSQKFVSHSEWYCVLCLPKGTIVRGGHQMQMFNCDNLPKTIARFQAVVMLISHLLVINTYPNQGQLLYHFWYSSNPSVSCLWAE